MTQQTVVPHRPSRRDVIRLGAVGLGAAWVAPVLTTVAATPAGADSLPVCCVGPGAPAGCDLDDVLIALSDGRNWHLACFDYKSERFTCGSAIKIACPTSDPAVVDAWERATRTSACPPGLGAAINSDGSVAVSFASHLYPFAFLGRNGSCAVWGVTPHRASLERCSYLPSVTTGAVVFPLAPHVCTSLPYPSGP
jgi:hypothetical protein